MTDMVCLKIVECQPLTNDPEACKDLPEELWMPLDSIPSYVSKLVNGKEVARLAVAPCR